MSKHLFIIYDEGEKWKITGTRLEMDDNFVVDPLLYFETPSEEFYLFVKELISGDNDVSYLKEISPSEASDLSITPLDSLMVHKAKIRTKGTYILKQFCDFTLQFDFFEYSVLNNKLIDKGYIITNENREEKYLEIINTGDNDLISDLDTYLEIRDRLTISSHNYNNYQEFKTIVNDSPDETSVNEAYANFAALYS